MSTYLVHYGYCATAEQFNKNAESVYADELKSMRNRQRESRRRRERMAWSLLLLSVIQHLLLDGRTTDAIDKTKELFPSLLNDKNLLFTLKVRQFIEMINGTESEISHSSLPSNAVTLCPSSRSRSNSPYSSTSHVHSNGTLNTSSPRRGSTTNLLPTVNSAGMEIDDETRPTNGFNHHQRPALHSSTINGHHEMDVECSSSETISRKIINFWRGSFNSVENYTP